MGEDRGKELRRGLDAGVCLGCLRGIESMMPKRRACMASRSIEHRVRVSRSEPLLLCRHTSIWRIKAWPAYNMS